MDLRQKFLPDFIRDLENAVKAYDAFDTFLKRTDAKEGEDFDSMPNALKAAFILHARQVLSSFL